MESAPRNPEPLITVGGVTTLVTAILALVVAFGAPLTADQQSAILGVAAVVGPGIVAIVARHWVSPAYKVGDAWAEGYQEAGRDASAESTHPRDVSKPSPEIDTSDSPPGEPGVGHDGIGRSHATAVPDPGAGDGYTVETGPEPQRARDDDGDGQPDYTPEAK